MKVEFREALRDEPTSIQILRLEAALTHALETAESSDNCGRAFPYRPLESEVLRILKGEY